MFKVVIIQPADEGRSFPDIVFAELVDFHVVQRAGTVSEGIEAILDHQPDLVLLDVEVSEENSFRVFEATRDLKYEKIILSELTRYIFKAARFDVADYLLKPLDPQVLRSCLLKLLSERGGHKIRRMYQQMFLNELGIDYCVFRTLTRNRIVSVRRLVRVENAGKRPYVVLDNGEGFHTTQSFREVCNMLRHSGMFLLNAEQLIRLRMELKLCTTEDGETECRLVDGSAFRVAPEKLDALRSQLDSLAPDPEPNFKLMDLPRHDRLGDNYLDAIL